jgi:hypothetical protein
MRSFVVSVRAAEHLIFTNNPNIYQDPNIFAKAFDEYNSWIRPKHLEKLTPSFEDHTAYIEQQKKQTLKLF